MSTDFFIGKAAQNGQVALCAVRPVQTCRRRVYQVMALSIVHGDVVEAERDLRRALARLGDGPKAAGPQRRATVQEQAEAVLAAAAELERLDQVGAGYVAKAGGDVDLARLARLLDAGMTVQGVPGARQAINYVRSQLCANYAHPGPLGVALARAIQAAGG